MKSRSRYSAFVVGDPAYLLATWHPSTRPPALELDPGVRWLGLDVLPARAGVEVLKLGAVEEVQALLGLLDLDEQVEAHGTAGRQMHIEDVGEIAPQMRQQRCFLGDGAEQQMLQPPAA